MIDAIHVALALVVLVVLVMLTIYVADWALSKFSPLTPRGRGAVVLVAVVVFLLLLAMIVSFFPYWVRIR